MYTFSQCQHFRWQTELPFLQYWFQSREQVNISYRTVWRNAPVLLHGYLLRNPWPKRTCALEHCCEEETNCWFSIFLLTPSLQQWRMSMSISLFTVLQFPSCSNFHKLHQRIPETFWSYYVLQVFCAFKDLCDHYYSYNIIMMKITTIISMAQNNVCNKNKLYTLNNNNNNNNSKTKSNIQDENIKTCKQDKKWTMFTYSVNYTGRFCSKFPLY